MYCVYFHRHPITNEIVYIGHGTKQRAYTTSYRNKKWIKFITEYPNYLIEIFKDNLTKEDAFELESELIKKEKPLFNCKTNQTLRSNIDFEQMNHLFYIDSNSLSGLSCRMANKAINPSIRREAGDLAGSKKYQTDGRPHAWQIMVNGKSYLIHRIIWVLAGNTLGSNTVIDHIDRNPFNNKLENLREVTHKENVANSSLRKTNTTGILNLTENRGRYTAYKMIDGVRVSKSYSISKYGKEEAKRLALKFLN